MSTISTSLSFFTENAGVCEYCGIAMDDIYVIVEDGQMTHDDLLAYEREEGISSGNPDDFDFFEGGSDGEGRFAYAVHDDRFYTIVYESDIIRNHAKRLGNPDDFDADDRHTAIVEYLWSLAERREFQDEPFDEGYEILNVDYHDPAEYETARGFGLCAEDWDVGPRELSWDETLDSECWEELDREAECNGYVF